MRNYNKVLIDRAFKAIKAFKIINKKSIIHLLEGIEEFDEIKKVYKYGPVYLLETKDDGTENFRFDLFFKELEGINSQLKEFTLAIYEDETYYVNNDGIALREEYLKLENLTMTSQQRITNVSYINKNYIKIVENTCSFMKFKKVNIAEWDWIRIEGDKNNTKILTTYINRSGELKVIGFFNLMPMNQDLQIKLIGEKFDIDTLAIFIDIEQMEKYHEHDISKVYQYCYFRNERLVTKSTMKQIRESLIG